MSRSIESLELELERIERRLKRESKNDNEHNLKIARARVRRAQSHKSFLLSQDSDKISSTLESIERQQVMLAEQIATLQERARYYSDLLDNRAELLSRADDDIERCQQHLDKLSGKEPTVGSVNETWAAIQKMLQGTGNGN